MLQDDARAVDGHGGLIQRRIDFRLFKEILSSKSPWKFY